jgi:hypothetical protein
VTIHGDHGPELTSRDVRDVVAIGRKADADIARRPLMIQSDIYLIGSLVDRFACNSP